MKPAAQTTFAERAGRVFGRMWRAGARLDRKAQGWLVTRGLGAGVAAGPLWVVKFAVLAVLLYGAFWVALLLVFVVAAAWAARNGGLDEDDQRPEWKEGHEGFGLYDKSDWRIDPHVSDDG
ncbi:DUF3742 family protein [Xanthomonas hyacinthi]|uniref:DUF3742 domain-containing protein n=1 Tax=Xanthomonas hyacinthi TaxID=56455 RepID=A0A2S7ENX2_9XANT|nr:DUF3742 family protein [Xanthomonas hyacinthi]KLD75515.1 hypothetical protein Y886_26525 [Xanthomonas hyacinthi DSM 19077]PPU93663.1 DUF3742 domain-containing protein [Xanthomonas hyacinthi]QGY75370.1 DUF3742 family protein [Xanthomonas hyacinthi]